MSCSAVLLYYRKSKKTGPEFSEAKLVMSPRKYYPKVILNIASHIKIYTHILYERLPPVQWYHVNCISASTTCLYAVVPYMDQ